MLTESCSLLAGRWKGLANISFRGINMGNNSRIAGTHFPLEHTQGFSWHAYDSWLLSITDEETMIYSFFIDLRTNGFIHLWLLCRGVRLWKMETIFHVNVTHKYNAGRRNLALSCTFHRSWSDFNGLSTWLQHARYLFYPQKHAKNKTKVMEVIVGE